jgi:hypothetical protein
MITASDMITGLYVLKPTYIRAARLEGLVTDSLSGNPITGATISFVDTTISVNSNNEGLYKTGIPKAGTFTIKIEKAGYITKYISVTLANGAKVVANVQLGAIVSGLVHNNSLDNQLNTFISGNFLQVNSGAKQTLKNLEIYDVTGRVQGYSNAVSNEQSLDISAYAKGIYFLRAVYANDEFATRKFVIH